MAISGRRPSGRGMSNNRHAPTHQWTDVEDTPFSAAPRLAPRRTNGQSWSAALRQRWAAWSSMPHCRLWRPSDWEFARDSLEICARFHDSGAAAWSTELRYREKVMGTTHDARQGMRIRYVTPLLDVTSAPAQLQNYEDL